MRKKNLAVIIALAMTLIMLPVSSFAFDMSGFIFKPQPQKKTYEKQAVLLVQGRSKDDKSVNLTWNTIEGADKYCVYGSLCGNDIVKIKTTTERKLQVKKVDGKKLKAHKVYRFYVQAIDAEGNEIITSRKAFVIVGKTKGNYANATNIFADTNFRIMNLHSEIKPQIYVNVYKDMKHLGTGYCPRLRYYTDCPEVVSVDKNGYIRANNEGEATIYVQDTCGIYEAIEIWVYKNITLNGVTYQLNDDWTYDDLWWVITNNKNPKASYIVESYFDDEECHSIEERMATFAPDGSDGFDISTIKVNGQKALLVAEPVNEIMDYHIFFYDNGDEHVINYSTDFEYNDIEEYTQEFLKLITWGNL